MPPHDAAPGDVTERTETPRVTETTEKQLRQKEASSVLSVVSVHSVLSVISVSEAEAARVVHAMHVTATARPWQRALFRFARVLKGLKGVLDPEAPPQIFADLLRLWHRASRLKAGPKPVPWEDVYGEFLASWRKIRWPAGNPLGRLVAEIQDYPPEAEAYEADETRLLVALCAALQREAGKKPFYLSCRTAAEAVGLDRMQVHRRLQVLVADDLLQVVKPGTKTRATRYRWTSTGEQPLTDVEGDPS